MTEGKVNSAFSGTEFRGETSGVGISGTDFRGSGGQPEPSAPLHEKDVDIDCRPPPYQPPSDLQYQNVSNQIRPFNAGLTNDDATKALLAHVSKSCCMGKNAAKKMQIKNIEYSFIHVLALETFSEKRQTSWDYKPFRGGHVDDASMGRVPGVWEVHPSVEPQPFKNGKYTCNMPHTEYIQSCYKCRSTGKVECYMCHSQGSEICSFCNGAGSRDGISCNSCNGRGRKSCFTCNSSGFKECTVCMGSGKLKYFQKLKITWTNHLDEFVSEPNFIPKDKLKLVTGDVIYKDKNARVFPINYPSLPEITQASQSLITKHEHVYLSKERPLIQQQTVQVIQVASVHYDYSSKPGVFYIFGKESRVHAPSYPSSCCMCTIM